MTQGTILHTKNGGLKETDTRTSGQQQVLPDNSPETQYIRQLGYKLVATIPEQYKCISVFR